MTTTPSKSTSMNVVTSFPIQNPFTDNVIDIEGNSTQAGALLDAFEPKSGNNANQMWEFKADPAGSGYYFIRNPATGLVIDIQENSTKDGALLDAFTEKSGSDNPDNQLWQLIADPSGSGACFIQSKLSGNVIDIQGNSAANGAALDVFPMKLFNNHNQLWDPFGETFPAAVAMAKPPGNLGGFNQYVFSGGEKTAVALKDIKVTIDVIEDIVTTSLSVQVNGFAPSGDTNIDWQQYGVRLSPESNQLQVFANNWPDPITNTDYLFSVTTPTVVTFPTPGTIPAGYKIVIELTNQTDGTVTGVKDSVYDKSETLVGTQTQALLGLGPQKGGNVTQTDLAKMVAFQVVLVGWANQAHAQFSSGMGTITCESTTAMTPSIAWPGYSDGANGTAESSNCLYGLVPARSSHFIVQAFGVPNPSITNIAGVSEFVVTGQGFFPNDKLTLKCLFVDQGSGASENFPVTCTAADDGTFSCIVNPPNFPGPEYPVGDIATFNVIAMDQIGTFAQAGCELDAEGRIANFQRGSSGPGNKT